MQVHQTLGPGFIESIYQRALIRELETQGLSVKTELEAEVVYKSAIVGKHRLDLVVENQVVVELKAVGSIAETTKPKPFRILRLQRFK